MGKYDGFWEMYQGGPHDDAPAEIFKCTDCGAETHHVHGHDGEPDTSKCKSGCKSISDWSSGRRKGRRYGTNFDRIFPNAPGAGL